MDLLIPKRNQARSIQAMSESPSVLHLTAHFSGRVQGVGFRYTVYQVAKEFEVSGYVQNLSDGRVRLEAEGERVEEILLIRKNSEDTHVFERLEAVGVLTFISLLVERKWVS